MSQDCVCEALAYTVLLFVLVRLTFTYFYNLYKFNKTVDRFERNKVVWLFIRVLVVSCKIRVNIQKILLKYIMKGKYRLIGNTAVFMYVKCVKNVVEKNSIISFFIFYTSSTNRFPYQYLVSTSLKLLEQLRLR